MTREEWLKIGLQNGLIDLEQSEQKTFECAYHEWFMAKCNISKPSTVDRIEVTYKRYFANMPLVEMYTSNIAEKDMIAFILATTAKYGAITKRDYDRIFQILRGVLNYVKDLGLAGSRLYDWESIKRNTPGERIITEEKTENAPSKAIINHIITSVVHDNIYQLKRSASLLLCMNFYLGLRIGELAALQFTDFDVNNRVVRIHAGDSKYYERDEEGNKTKLVYATGDPKNQNAVRTIPLMPEVIYIFKQLEEHHKICGYNSTYLCYDGADVIRIRSLDRTLRRLCKLCCTPEYNSHLIRKTFATTLHHANVPTRVISDIMGHSEMRTTERNYILTFEDSNAMYYDYMKQGLVYN